VGCKNNANLTLTMLSFSSASRLMTLFDPLQRTGCPLNNILFGHKMVVILPSIS